MRSSPSLPDRRDVPVGARPQLRLVHGFGKGGWHPEAPGKNRPQQHVIRPEAGLRQAREDQRPVIAQVHGFCLAGGSELATGCDVVYMAEDAQMGYPAVRFGVPDMQFHAWLVGMRRGMEMMLTGDSIDGIEAEKRGWATRAFPAEELEAKTLEYAQRMAALPPDIVQLNKRAVHRQMSIMGLRDGIRQGTELCSLAIHQPSFKEFIGQTGKGSGKLTSALQKRDEKFGDYRTGDSKES